MIFTQYLPSRELHSAFVVPRFPETRGLAITYPNTDQVAASTAKTKELELPVIYIPSRKPVKSVAIVSRGPTVTFFCSQEEGKIRLQIYAKNRKVKTSDKYSDPSNSRQMKPQLKNWNLYLWSWQGAVAWSGLYVQASRAELTHCAFCIYIRAWESLRVNFNGKKLIFDMLCLCILVHVFWLARRGSAIPVLPDSLICIHADGKLLPLTLSGSKTGCQRKERNTRKTGNQKQLKSLMQREDIWNQFVKKDEIVSWSPKALIHDFVQGCVTWKFVWPLRSKAQFLPWIKKKKKNN